MAICCRFGDRPHDEVPSRKARGHFHKEEKASKYAGLETFNISRDRWALFVSKPSSSTGKRFPIIYKQESRSQVHFHHLVSYYIISYHIISCHPSTHHLGHARHSQISASKLNTIIHLEKMQANRNSVKSSFPVSPSHHVKPKEKGGNHRVLLSCSS